MFDYFISSGNCAYEIDQNEVNKRELVINIVILLPAWNWKSETPTTQRKHFVAFCRFDDTKTSLICELSSN